VTLPEQHAEPCRSRGGAGGAARDQAAPAWHRQKVKVPRRVWGGSYSAGAAAYWAQITALAQRADGCRASVATLARYMGDAKRTAERVLAELAAPGPDGQPELTTVRRTGSDGDGETAERRTRGTSRTEHFAYVPVLAAKTLRRPLFVLYCALTYAVATRTPVTAAELADVLGVTEYSARRMTTELEDLGWITVHRRAGAHGRHDYDVHDQPLHLVPSGPGRPHTDGGSGACADGGSLAIKEDPGLTDESNSTHAGGAFRRRRGDGKWVGPPVDNSPQASVASVAPAAFRAFSAPSARPQDGRTYDGPPLTLSPRVWAVLEPVRDLLPSATTFMARKIAREVGRQLDTGIWAEDIRDQLARLRRWTPTEAINDAGAWIYACALPARPGPCGGICHYGFLPYTGMPCKACAELRSAHPPPPDTGTWHECSRCQRPTRHHLTDGRCADCPPAA
jgi:hypothetical protein